MNKAELELYLNNIERPLILDGAMGSLLQQREGKVDKALWTSYLNFRKPKIIQEIHREYITSGCDIITTNTFRTNPLAISKTDIEVDINIAVKQSVNISKIIADEYKVLLAGSNPPAEDCYQTERTISKSELEFNHKKHIELLYVSGVDIILNETQSHWDEIEFLCKYCSQNCIPYVISLFVLESIKILSGEQLSDVIEMIKPYSPIMILFNCINVQVFEKIKNEIELDFDWGFYLNCGSGNFTDSEINCGISPYDYLEIVKSSLSYKPKLVGSCCGSNPDHIKLIKALFDEKINSKCSGKN